MTVRGPLRRAPEVQRAPVADGALLVDPVLVRAHGLNATATAIWDRLGGDPDPETVATRVATAFGLDPAAVRDGVNDAIDRFLAEGLVTAPDDTTARTPPSSLPGQFANVPSTGEAVPDGHATLPWRHPIGPFRGLDVTFDLTTTEPDVGRYLAEVWAPLALDATEPPPARLRRYTITGDRPEAGLDHLVALDGEVVARTTSRAAAVAVAVWHANQLVSTESTRLLQVHASAVAIDGAAVVLPAAMNSGKSTLAAALVASGARYLTDEAVALDPGTGLVVPYPKAITFDPGSWPLFADLEPPVQRSLPELAHAKWYVDPSSIRADATAPPTPPAALVFPTYDPTRPTTTEPLTPVDAAAELARNCFNLRALGQVGVDLVARLASSLPATALSVRALDEGVAAVRRLALDAAPLRPS